MTNKDIAGAFRELASLMELHQENPYKIRSYSNAYISLRKLGAPLSEMTDEQIRNIKGVGEAIAQKIRSLLDTGRMPTLEKYREKTPPGVRELLGIKGFGPKKVRTIWKELGVESVVELLYACNENRLVELKGFGEKTQVEWRKLLEYYLRSKDQYLYANLEEEAGAVLMELLKAYPEARWVPVGAFARKMPVLMQIEWLTNASLDTKALENAGLSDINIGQEAWTMKGPGGFPLTIHLAGNQPFGNRTLELTGPEAFLSSFRNACPEEELPSASEEHAIFEAAGFPFIAPEMRDWEDLPAHPERIVPEDLLVQDGDIQGVVHAHSTYSDGMNSLEEMALAARAAGYHYLAITDHSQAAFYANGLKEDRVIRQWEEIDRLNAQLAPFRIFKGIESDILSDGSLDYPEAILEGFELVIASIHSNLKMEEEKATLRLIRAIENPYTRILGHPTGRLLLARPGYPIDHQRVIDACAANGVAIEINAHPYRLDLDWKWIPYALEKEILISVNPDAHSTEGIRDIHYGIHVARKGGLTAGQCLNARSVADFEMWVNK